MSLFLHFKADGPAKAGERVAGLADMGTHGLMDALGAEAVSQTHRRIRHEKRGPDGTPWGPWTPGYAETRHGGQSLLLGEGHLDDSIGHQVAGDGRSVLIGTNLVYGAIHQFGGAEAGKPEIPARPYLGFSDENLAGLEAVTDAWVASQLEAL